jgi:hypothetical protein
MKLLQELRRFHVKKESVGFELRELGQLEKIGGALDIYGLENVTTREEANEAKLMAKRSLTELALIWCGGQPSIEDDIVDGLEPHSNVRALSIVVWRCHWVKSWWCHWSHLVVQQHPLEELGDPPSGGCILVHSSSFWADASSRNTQAEKHCWDTPVWTRLHWWHHRKKLHTVEGGRVC